jgi:hypothetical protein
MVLQSKKQRINELFTNVFIAFVTLFYVI